jgi:Zn-dependent peptidase ImmA (M78 family)
MGVVYRQPIGGETDPMEQEANGFAANLLVPEFLLRRYYHWAPEEEAAAIFGVSAEVMRYRLQRTARI